MRKAGRPGRRARGHAAKMRNGMRMRESESESERGKGRAAVQISILPAKKTL